MRAPLSPPTIHMYIPSAPPPSFAHPTVAVAIGHVPLCAPSPSAATPLSPMYMLQHPFACAHPSLPPRLNHAQSMRCTSHCCGVPPHAHSHHLCTPGRCTRLHPCRVLHARAAPWRHGSTSSQCPTLRTMSLRAPPPSRSLQPHLFPSTASARAMLGLCGLGGAIMQIDCMPLFSPPPPLHTPFTFGCVLTQGGTVLFYGHHMRARRSAAKTGLAWGKGCELN
ncbi:hypothetical protein DFH07DRAFT_1029173 [Mycena maculata]|uniref:Uncharacterized protein n=1 Tax=Mycena maculata TaxID=230809 RepID=A0AAD7J170_9AGAR|nr:hypothetical protein DFH07DRAFT_1029173 [Mycena maculata]